ncbi:MULTISPECIES: 50S ribosomal protein L35 [Congzhengia]|uniref:Large ribosomal subunit protein bL35 n=1 Tax=Congzhengia minquanensis TaxID=2763657 RepID=A0A926HZK7_9FIRM|nr:50S ribosomal protein L35 [Congzhengia minquanensis]MBC8541548.1 50S ribosomal protein L35 [Congzhengia minquanensis]MBD8947292.1 50S ribosomal protein L35 [Clostridiales bacterium]HBL82621.1 50S ribosomal protein L35 [Clostridiales bacterium]
MPKIKTHRASAKRFRITKNGKVKMKHNYTSHILTKKSTKRKRKLRKGAYASNANLKTIKKMIPYK